MKAPNSKLQVLEKFQAASSKTERRTIAFDVRRLELLWCLDIGAWSFFET
jgi:hypothetical protein